jgi:peptide chain release factor 1
MSIDRYIATSREHFAELERAISGFDFTHGDQGQYLRMNRDYQRLKQLLELWQQLQKTQQELRDNAELLAQSSDHAFTELIEADVAELEKQQSQLDRQIKILILPPHPNEGRDVIIELRPAAGGDEAGLFAADLLRMYSRYAELKGWRQEILELSETPLGGLKNASFTLRGEGAWSCMRLESGVHRVQRIPSTETQGRIHTSTVTVAVLAEAEEVELELKPEELRIDVFRSSGHGGQSVNTTDSAVRVTHLPSGIFVASQQEKSQHRNKEVAMRILRARLLEMKQSQEDAKNAAERRSQVGSGDRSERIRTYNFPQNRVTDHRYDITRYDLNSVMEGELDELLNEIRAIEANRQLAQELNI